METPRYALSHRPAKPPGTGLIEWDWPDSRPRKRPFRWEDYTPPEFTPEEERAVERAVELLELRRSWEGSALDFPHEAPGEALEAVTGPPERFSHRYYTLSREAFFRAREGFGMR